MTTINRDAAKSPSRVAARDGGCSPWLDAWGDGPVAALAVAVRSDRRWQRTASDGRALQ
ncbi:hypothetical protein E9232_006341 [Inquilinus ginsengisoli]|uniref:Uncharacterized protein n=1 Tax=Inquilinus ginsengisoli TaxID=363840 RepID=A0ABU1JYU0_9PROT|nr:hypothetical protein [Inquilinus ginsengisoli]